MQIINNISIAASFMMLVIASVLFIMLLVSRISNAVRRMPLGVTLSVWEPFTRYMFYVPPFFAVLSIPMMLGVTMEAPYLKAAALIAAIMYVALVLHTDRWYRNIRYQYYQ